MNDQGNRESAEFRRHHLGIQKGELNARYDALTKRIGGLNVELAQEMDHERKITLEARLGEVVAERDKVSEQLEEVIGRLTELGSEPIDSSKPLSALSDPRRGRKLRRIPAFIVIVIALLAVILLVALLSQSMEWLIALFGPIQIPTETPTPTATIISTPTPASSDLPIIDHFEYTDNNIAQTTWTTESSGNVTVFTDASRHAPVVGSTRSLKIESNVPAAIPRYMQACNTLPNGPLDFNPYHQLEISVQGDGADLEPQGGEFSIVLVEWDPITNTEERWQSTRWLARTTNWKQPINIALSGNGQSDPWSHPNDFVVPTWEQPQDGVLNLHSIRAVCIRALTMDTDAASYPSFTVWIDELRLR